MTGRYRLQKTAKKLNVQKEDVRTRIPANLGLTIGGSRVVEKPTRLGYHYARIRGNLSEVVEVYNTATSPIYDLPVLISYRNNRWEVEGKDTGKYSSWGSSAYLPRHGAQHAFDPDAPGADITWIWGRQMMPLAAIPSGSSGGPNVIIEESTYWQDNTWHIAGGTGTQNIIPDYKPTGSNARMVLVYLDGDGNPQLLGGGTYFAPNLTGTSQIVPYIPAMPNTDAIGIAGIRLLSGTSVITWNNIYDLRPWIVGSGYIPTGTSGVTDHGALTGLLDNDHPQYLLTGTAISSTDEKIKVSSNDTISGYLNGKLVEGAGISLAENNNGGNETLSISYTGTASSGAVSLTESQVAFGSATNTVTGSSRFHYHEWDTISNTLIIGGSGDLHEDYKGWNFVSITDQLGGNLNYGHAIYSYGPNYPPYLQFYRARGTEAEPTGTVAEDELMTIGFCGYGSAGSGWDGAGSIQAIAREIFTSTQRGAELRFNLSNTGASPSQDFADVLKLGYKYAKFNGLVQTPRTDTHGYYYGEFSVTGTWRSIVNNSRIEFQYLSPTGWITQGWSNTGSAGTGTDTDEKTKISANDTTAGYLNGKLIEGAGISLTEVGDGGNETLRISYTGTANNGQIKLRSVDVLGYAEDKILPGTGISFSYMYPDDGSSCVLTINNTMTGSVGSPGEQGPPGSNTILIYDDGIFKATGTAFSFNDGLNVHITGSIAYINWTGTAGSQGIDGAPGSNTLLIYDDNIFKVTGTSLHFNDNLNVITTGSTAYINIETTDGIFLMSAMRYYDGTMKDLLLLFSKDGKSWNFVERNKKFFTPAEEYLKDPSITYWNNYYWVCYSAVAEATTVFGVAKSSDLYNWEFVGNVDMSSIPGLVHTWAPEWFIDNDNSVHVSVTCNAEAGIINNFKIYEVHPTSNEMSTWSSPVMVTGTFPSSVIDARWVNVSGTYYLWYKDNLEEVIEYCSSSSLTSGYTPVQVGDWAGWGTKKEAPHVIQLDNGDWRMYMQHYDPIPGEHIDYSDSSDGWVTWTAPAPIISPWRVMHGTQILLHDLDTVQRVLTIKSAQSTTYDGGDGTVMGAYLRRAVEQTLPHNTGTAIIWDTEDRDDNYFWDIANPTRFLIQNSGWYIVNTTVDWNTNSTGQRNLDFKLNGTTWRMSTTQNAFGDNRSNLSECMYLSAGDYIELIAMQNSTANLACTAKGSIVFLTSVNENLSISENGTFKTTGTALDFGAGFSVSVTGSMAYINFTGSSGSGHTIQDDGVSQTQRTNFNFVGDGFLLWDDAGNNATIVSGTSVPGIQGPQGEQGIPGVAGGNTLFYDDGVFKGTGTAVSFDAGLSVAVTGTTVFVASFGSGIPISGWVTDNNTWTWSSGDDPTYVIETASNVTGTFSAGMRFKINDSSTKQFIITKVAFVGANTRLSMYGGTDYDLTSGTLSSPYYSSVKAPQGFPLDPTKWTVEVTDTSDRSQATPTQNVWYNLGSISITIPIGIWKVSRKAQTQASDSTNAGWNHQCSLSTANNSESDVDFTTMAGINATLSYNIPTYAEKTLVLASKTIYYLISRTTNANEDAIQIRGDVGKTIIRAICAYL